MTKNTSDRFKVYCIHKTEWRGISLEIGHMPSWCSGVDHIEIRSENRRPIPITETGYKSLFVSILDTEVTSDPVGHVLTWLDHEATKPDWIKIEANYSQLSLFKKQNYVKPL